MRPPTLAGWLARALTVAVALGAPARVLAASTEAQRVGVGVVELMRASTQHVQRRANAIAAAPSLVYAVATDQQTMLDMTADELSFHAQPGEIVEVGQRQLATDKVISLRREGSDAALLHLPLQKAGLFLITADERLYALAVVEVRPRERANVVRGMVGVARAIDLAPASARLEHLGAGALVETRGSGNVLIGRRPASAGTLELDASIGTDVDPKVILLMPGSSTSFVGALTVVGLAAFVVAFVLMRRRRASQGGALALR